MIFTKLTQTCSACPSQWEAETADGEHIYIRYRWGTLYVGFGLSIEEAVRDSEPIGVYGDGFDGVMTTEEMLENTGFVFDPEEN